MSALTNLVLLLSEMRNILSPSDTIREEEMKAALKILEALKTPWHVDQPRMKARNQ